MSRVAPAHPRPARRPARPAAAVVLLAALLAPPPAGARLVPVLQRQVPALAKKRARLYVVRPCRCYTVEGHERVRLLPGDPVRLEGPLVRHRRPVPHTVVVSDRSGARVAVKLIYLSRRRPDYAYRGKGSFEAFYTGLVRDLPRQTEAYIKLAQRHDYHIPVIDKSTGQLSDAHQAAKAYFKQLGWARAQLMRMGYSGRSERSVLRDEKDWITRRGEAFIRGFAGQGPADTKARLKKMYLLLNRLTRARTAVGRIRRHREQMARLKAGDRYKDLEPAHRGRLIAEDVAEQQTKLARWETTLNTVVAEVRSSFAALGVEVR